MVDRKEPNLPDLKVLEGIALPTLPHIFSEVTAVTNKTDTSIHDLHAVIEKDQAMAARILRIANSAAFGFFSRVSTLEHGCSLLGMRMVTNIVLQTSLIGQYEKLRGLPNFDIDEFWEHTILVAAACRNVAKKWGKKAGLKPDECYTAGLLHDIGRLVLLDKKSIDYVKALGMAAEQNMPINEAEAAVFGFDHAEVGGYLAMRWNFPSIIQAGIRGHHAPQVDEKNEEVQLLVYACNELAHGLKEMIFPEALETLNPRVFEVLQIEPDAFEEEFQNLLANVPSY